MCIVILFSSLNVGTVEAVENITKNDYSFISETNNTLFELNQIFKVTFQEITKKTETNLKKDVEREKRRLKKTQKKKEKKEREQIIKQIKNIESNNTCNINKKYLEYLGEYKLTAYCPFTCCCGSYGITSSNQKSYTSSGAVAKEGVTIAVDPSVIPYGTIVIIEIDGKQYKYIAQDCGGAIKGKTIDVFFNSHEKANHFGKKYGKVYVLKNS